MRDNFYEYEDSNGLQYCAELSRGVSCMSCMARQVTKDMVLSEGVEAVRSRIRAEDVSLGILRRPWNWNAEQNAEPKLPITGS